LNVVPAQTSSDGFRQFGFTQSGGCAAAGVANVMDKEDTRTTARNSVNILFDISFLFIFFSFSDFRIQDKDGRMKVTVFYLRFFH